MMITYLRSFLMLLPLMLVVLTTPVAAQIYPDIADTVDWNVTGTQIAVGHHSGLVEVIDSSTGQVLRSFQLSGAIQVAWSPQNSDLLAVSGGGVDGPGIIYILNTAT